MPKFPTFPTLYDEVLQINISKLMEWGYLRPDQIKSGTLSWNSNGHKTGSISIRANTLHMPFIELDYKYQEELRNYKVRLVSVPSNLGKGKVWYFLCPKTNKRCRKLYLIGGYFYHREAFNGCMYECQVQGKFFRALDKTLGACFRADQLYDQLYSKNFKKYYAGKPTKKYARIMEKLKYASEIDMEEVEKQLLI